MANSGGHVPPVRARRVFCGLLILTAALAASLSGEGAGTAARQGERVDIRLRSFAPGATGTLTVEPSAGGGRARLTARGLPEPRTQSRDARAYVVWANGDGRIVRLGELRRDARGNGGLAFTHPAGFDRYTVLVTAEASADASRPLGAPVLSTRAGEAQPVYPAPVPAATPATPPAVRPTPQPAHRYRARRATGADFYGEVDDALAAQGGGRLLTLEGGEVAPAGRGRARVTAHTGRAYAVVRFSDVPLPPSAGANVYVMWAVLPDGRIIYMGSLPADETLNRSDIYVRVPGFTSDAYDLFVTAERQRPAPEPSDRRVLSTRNALNALK